MENYREYLNEIDMKCIDENLHFYDLRSLYESTVPNLSPEDKQELKKVLDSTNDPEIIAAALTAKATKDKNESLEEDEQVVDKKVWYNVFIESPGGVKHSLTDFDAEVEAEDFCNQHDWHWADENGFDWHLDYEEKLRDWEDWEKDESIDTNKVEKGKKAKPAFYDDPTAGMSKEDFIDWLVIDKGWSKEDAKRHADLFYEAISEKKEIFEEANTDDEYEVWYYLNTAGGERRPEEPRDLIDFKYEDNLSTNDLIELFIDLDYVYLEDEPSLNDCFDALESHDFTDGGPIIYKINKNNQKVYDDSKYWNKVIRNLQKLDGEYEESLNESSDSHFQVYDEKIKRAGYTDDEIAKVISIADEYEKNADNGFISYAEMDEYADKMGLKDMSDSELRRAWDLYYDVLSREAFTDDESTGLDKYHKYSDAASAFAEVINREARRRKEAGNYNPDVDESLNEAKFGPYKYRYEVHWISPEGKDILLGANNDFEAVENIAINQIKRILENPWESNENKYKIIDSLYIYDSEKDDADVMGISLEDYIDGILSELDSRIRTNSLDEDTIKQNGKWVNKGKEGTHGTFATKKAADAQRRAMFSNGYKESLDNNYSWAEKKLLDLVQTANSDYTLDDIQLYITPKGNINIRTKDDKDIMTVNRFSDDMIDELRLQGYFDSYDSLDLGESLNESKNESLTEDIYEDDDGDYDDNEFEKGRDGCYYKYISSKSVYDSDGFTTDYTLYMKAEPVKDRFDVSFVTVFGDSDIYRPDDGNYDYETDDLDNAIEWFDSYNGFEDDEFDESLQRGDK